MDFVVVHGDSAFKEMFPVSHQRKHADSYGQDCFNDMVYLRGMYRGGYTRDKLSDGTTYLVYYENQSFEYPAGEYEDGTQAYSTYTGPMPIGVLKLAERDDGIVLCYVTVSIFHRNTGIATKLIGKLDEWLSDNKVTKLLRTGPSEMGLLYTAEKISDMLTSNNITFEFV